MVANVPTSSCHDFMQEDDYIPHVKDLIGLQKAFDKPFAAGNAIARQQNKKPSGKPRRRLRLRQLPEIAFGPGLKVENGAPWVAKALKLETTKKIDCANIWLTKVASVPSAMERVFVAKWHV